MDHEYIYSAYAYLTEKTALTSEDDAIINDALNFMNSTKPRGKSQLEAKRYSVLVLAVATTTNQSYRLQVRESWHSRRHFELHCLLCGHPVYPDRLRSEYGSGIDQLITPKQARDRAKHYTAIAGVWPWKHFSPKELADNGSGLLYVEPLLLDRLEFFRELNGGKAITLSSGYRTPERNRRTPGAAPRSYHMLGMAVDILVKDLDPIEMLSSAEATKFGGIAQYAKTRVPRIHLDVRSYAKPWRCVKNGAFKPDVDYADLDLEDIRNRPGDNVKGATVGGVIGMGGKTIGDAAIAAVQTEPIPPLSGLNESADMITNISQSITGTAPWILLGIGVWWAWQYKHIIAANVVEFKESIWPSH